MNIISPYANATTATITYYASKLLNKLIGIYNVFAQLINIYILCKNELNIILRWKFILKINQFFDRFFFL